MEGLLPQLLGFLENGPLADLVLDGRGLKQLLLLHQLHLSGFLSPSAVCIHI